MAVGNRIRFIRGPLSQEEFAKTPGVQRNTIQMWEAEKRSPEAKLYLRFYKRLGGNINCLLSGEGEAYVNSPGSRGMLDIS